MRQNRIREKNGVYHVFNRINGKKMLLADSKIKEMFLQVIYEAKTKKKFNFKLINVTVMDNHFHLIVKTKYKDDISKLMHWIGFVFAQRYNRKTGQSGHVWTDRFKSILLKTKEIFEKTFRYVCENPVRAGLAESILTYKYGYFTLLRHFLIGRILESFEI